MPKNVRSWALNNKDMEKKTTKDQKQHKIGYKKYDFEKDSTK